MPFTPKFVDLVRNYTALQGTGAVTLGQAVSGYTGFSAACATGDQFYYCIQGIDKPQEREVGRGTMQANGSIVREPIGGAAVNFTKGAKTISLVTAAEWFAKVEAGGGAGGASVATRVLLAAQPSAAGQVMTLDEAGRGGAFLFKIGDLSTKVAADPNQGIYVAPASAPSGASGAWVRRIDGAVNVRWFGATGDGATDDGAAFVAALALLKLLASNDGVIYKGSPKLVVPAGHYFLGTTTLDITHTLVIEGEGSGKAGGIATKMRWAANTTGIRVQRYNTSGATTIDGVEHYAGDGSILRGLHLQGAFTNMASEGEHHGVFAKARVTCEDVFCNNWQGDGFRIGAPGGNANNVALIRCTAWYCRNGAVFDGADANAGYVEDYDFSFNRAYGFVEDSHLGNVWSGGHADSNGIGYLGADNIATLVSHDGNRYYVRFGQAGGASTNAPSGTTASNTWWGYQSVGGTAGSVIPAWTSGMVAREGGPYRVGGNPANQATIVGIYTEGGQPYAKGYGNALSISGSQNTPIESGGVVHVRAQSGHFTVPGHFQSFGNFYANGSNVFLGPDVLGTTDTAFSFRTGNTATNLVFTSHNPTPQVDAHVFVLRGGGIYFNAAAGVKFRHNGADVFSTSTTGLTLAVGKKLEINGTAVVAARKTGWATATGTATRTAFDTATVTTAQLAERVKALVDDLHATAGHGMIGA